MSKPLGKDVKSPNVPADVPVPNLKRRGISGFVSDVRREMKHVTWPTRKETTRLTGVVLAVCFAAVAILFGLGELFHFVIEALLKLRG